MGTESVWLSAFYKIFYFMFSRRKKRIWNNMRVSKQWQYLHVRVDYPFKDHFKDRW